MPKPFHKKKLPDPQETQNIFLTTNILQQTGDRKHFRQFPS